MLDDLRADSLAFNKILGYTDWYCREVPIKGSFVPWYPKIVVVTTISLPEHIYAGVQEDVSQLIRRIDVIQQWNETTNQWDFKKGNAAIYQ